MDEEEQKRQAASAAFAQAERQNRDSDGSIQRPNRIEADAWIKEHDRVADADMARFSKQQGGFLDAIHNNDADEAARLMAAPHLQYDAGTKALGEISNPVKEGSPLPFGDGTRYPFATQWDRDRAVAAPPAAASAFSQLDAPAPGPLDYDPATAAGLPQETQDAFQRNWDDNLAAARKAIDGNGPGKEERDALAIYTDQLVRMADDYQANRNGADRAQAPADPYAAQRQREAAIGKRMAQYDVFSSPTATTTLFTPDTARTNTYDRIMRDKSGKEVFDYFM